MAKLFNIPTVNKKLKNNTKQAKTKHSTTNKQTDTNNHKLINSTASNTKSPKKPSTNTKTVKSNKVDTVTKSVKKTAVAKKTTVAKKPIVIKKQVKSTTASNSSINHKWHNMSKTVPERDRPIELNSDYKKPIHGYKTYKGLITDNPYYLNKYIKNKGYIEWQYISGCNNLSKCPHGFPDCQNCNIYIRRQRELKKNA